MAWNRGLLYLGPKQTGRWWIRFRPDPGNIGPQWIMAQPLLHSGPVELVVTDHAKRIDYELGWTQDHGGTGYDPDSRFYTYKVTVRNMSDTSVVFTFEGGSVL